MGTLYYGDNLDILRRHLNDETVNPFCFHPPFDSAKAGGPFLQEEDVIAAASLNSCERKTDAQTSSHPQLATVTQLMEGRGLERPLNVAAVDETFKKALKAQPKGHHQHDLGL